jgi:ADP-heptose:LPS heptosyltransferase
VQLYSIQVGEGREQFSTFSQANRVIDLADRIETLHDTAAILQNLDLLICCDSAVAHLAGAMGRPVWIALPFSPDWRWLLEREDSPWYPTMRLFRQQQPGDWTELFERIAEALHNLA